MNQKAEKEKEFAAATAEVRALRRQPSNIPAHMLDLRGRVAQEVGLSETALPFAGEWIEVDADSGTWQGAIERVLHGLALSVMVEERYYARVSTFVNDAHLGGRLVYFRVGRVEEAATRPIPSNSLWHKLRVKSGVFTPWLDAELKQRFDYVCADSVQAFRSAEKAITREGQIRHGKTRHEKDDRFRIDDRRQWVLGFDNREKLALFELRAQELAGEIAALQRDIAGLTALDERCV